MHFPWDDGAITGTWLSVGQKTVKTRCNKRVAFSSITITGHVACPQCRANLAQRALECETIARDFPQHGADKAFGDTAAFLRKTLAQ